MSNISFVIENMVIGEKAVSEDGVWEIICHANDVQIGKKRYRLYRDGEFVDERVRSRSMVKFVIATAGDVRWLEQGIDVNWSGYVPGVGESGDTALDHGVEAISGFRQQTSVYRLPHVVYHAFGD